MKAVPEKKRLLDYYYRHGMKKEEKRDKLERLAKILFFMFFAFCIAYYTPYFIKTYLSRSNSSGSVNEYFDQPSASVAAVGSSQEDKKLHPDYKFIPPKKYLPPPDCICKKATRKDGHEMPNYCSQSPTSKYMICYVEAREACLGKKKSKEHDTMQFVACHTKEFWWKQAGNTDEYDQTNDDQESVVGTCGVKYAPMPDYAKYINEDKKLTFAPKVEHPLLYWMGQVKYLTHKIPQQLAAMPHWSWTKDRKEADVVLGRNLESTKWNNHTKIERFVVRDGFWPADKKTVAKVSIERTLDKIQEKYPECNLYKERMRFETYILEKEENCKKFFETNYKEPGSQWIIKPTYSSCGKGVYILNGTIDCENHDERGVLAQEYLSNPFLTPHGHKWDLRFYVIIASTWPLRVFTAPRHSIMRMSPHLYDMNNLQSFVTNLHVSGCYDDSCQLFENNYKKAGVPRDIWFKAVEKMGQMSYLIVENYLQQYPVSENRFGWFGFDYLLDDKGDPHFIEFNGSPDILISPGDEGSRSISYVNGLLNLVHAIHNKRPESEIQKIVEEYHFAPVIKLSK